MGTRNGEPIQFLRRVVAAPPIGCVEWPFRQTHGYGRLEFDGRTRGAHQVALELAGHYRSEDQPEARHLCGDKTCVNPRHLAWGSKSENVRDRFRLGEQSLTGERNPRARISEADVHDIRSARRRGDRVVEIARRYGVAASTISMLLTGQTWSHVAEVQD